MKQRKSLSKKQAVKRGYYIAIPLFLLNAFGLSLLQGYSIEYNRVLLNLVVWGVFGFGMGMLIYYLQKKGV